MRKTDGAEVFGLVCTSVFLIQETFQRSRKELVTVMGTWVTSPALQVETYINFGIQIPLFCSSKIWKPRGRCFEQCLACNFLLLSLWRHWCSLYFNPCSYFKKRIHEINWIVPSFFSIFHRTCWGKKLMEHCVMYRYGPK